MVVRQSEPICTTMRNNKMPLAFSYVRFSEARQGSGSSAAVQDTTAEEWCQRNGCSLDNRSYRGMGVSAFTGEHRKNGTRNGLALFLNALRGEERKIPEDSYFILYNLDRLSREDVRPAYALFNEILSHKVHIVQLKPEHIFRHDAIGPEALMDIFQAVMELSRGNSESLAKSNRIKDNWHQVRTAVSGGEPHAIERAMRHRNGKIGLPGKTPFWLTKTKTGYELNDKAEVVRRMFALARDGHGAVTVCRKINKEFRMSLSRPYVRNLLTGHPNRKVLGEWQPRDTNRNPIGEPVMVYPPVITQDLWDAVQGGTASRRISTTRQRDGLRVYLFNEFMRDLDGKKFTPHQPSKSLGTLKFIPVAALDGKSDFVSFPVEPFEAAMLEHLSEVNPADVLPKKGKSTADELAILNGKRAQLREKITDATEAMDESPKLIKSLAAKLATWEAEMAELEESIARLRHKAATPQSEIWVEAKSLLASVGTGDNETRTRFRGLLGGLIKDMTCVFVGRRLWRMAFVQVRFQDSRYLRNVVIRYRVKGNSFTGGRPEKLITDTWKDGPTEDSIHFENEQDTAGGEMVKFIVDYLNDLADEFDRDFKKEKNDARNAKRREEWAKGKRW